jgi:hypothetical protein
MSHHKGKFQSCELENISSKLKFIAKLSPGQKISVKAQCIQSNSYLTSIVRYLSGENRDNVYKFIVDLIQDAFSILESFSCSSNEYDLRVCKNMIIDLINLKPGLENLIKTYKKDHKYVAKVEVIIENLEVRIKKLCDERNLAYDDIIVEASEKFKKDEPVVNLDACPITKDDPSDSENEELEAAQEQEPEAAQEQTKPEDPAEEKKKTSDFMRECPRNPTISADPTTSADPEEPTEQLVETVPECENKIEAQPVAEISRAIPEQKEQRNMTYCDIIQMNSTTCSRLPREMPIQREMPQTIEINSGMVKGVCPSDLRRKKKKHIHQYDSYYRTCDEDIHLYQPDLQNPLIR